MFSEDYPCKITHYPCCVIWLPMLRYMYFVNVCTVGLNVSLQYSQSCTHISIPVFLYWHCCMDVTCSSQAKVDIVTRPVPHVVSSLSLYKTRTWGWRRHNWHFSMPKRLWLLLQLRTTFSQEAQFPLLPIANWETLRYVVVDCHYNMLQKNMVKLCL
jgi:hypothetical protein